MNRERSKERSCDLAIIKTLTYREIFKYPLSFYQLSTFLLSKHEYDLDFFQKSVRRLTKKGRIKIKNGTYYLPSVKPLSWEKRVEDTKKLIKTNGVIFDLLSSIPWVKMVGVTGSCAAYNAENSSDLDIIVISAKNRLWLTRGFVSILLVITGTYRKKVCPNIYMDETALEWDKQKQNVYTAHEVCMLQPIFDRDETYFRFMKANAWALDYFGQFKINLPKTLPEKRSKESGIVDFLDNLAMKMQLAFMHGKRTRETTQKHLIHFNKVDNSEWILNKYKKLLTS